ncbi:DUF2254 domain-containing protein [Massilia scottii]|uniref:DUF2254 domain-containing protein n=1 Tax=Massilia scottii TaxID=3057166 RepID=UPI00279651BA|nr:DUF2254 domain-containing protein [Massilia sp. CCM 9029]MDQ1833728.1 DUF2254 domain-containing protein [Massilia sp. CCM 9029]
MARLKQLWSDMRASFWFLPCLIVALAVTLAFVLTHLDESALEQWMKRYPNLFGASAAGAREMLSTIAGSMISVVGIVFSMTLVALALASSQYSSRVLRTFMRSRVTQTSIGIFAGIFVYCLIVLRGVHGKDESVFVPVLAVSAAMLLAVVGVVVLIFFIHHIALSIQASTILANIAEETIDAMQSMFRPQDAAAAGEPAHTEADVKKVLATLCWIPIPAMNSGYLQSIDYTILLKVASERRLIVRVERAVGQFVLAGTPLFSVAGERAASLDGTLNATIAVSAYRTVEQDPGFGVRQLVDVALKALSPGVNDTTTAVMCLDYLGAVMATMGRLAIPSPYQYDQGALKIIAAGPDYADMLGEAFDQIRRDSGGNVSVILRMIAVIDTLSALVVGEGRRDDLRAQLEFLAELGARTVAAPQDSTLIASALAPVRRSLAITSPQRRKV